MPVDWSKYPANWRDLVAAVAARAGGRCECQGECGRCRPGERCPCLNHQPSPVTGRKVTLTTAHLDHDTTHNDLTNLRHLCNGCHLRYDRNFHRRNATRTRIRRREEAGQMRLCEGD